MKCINSILSQTYQCFEIIIIYDNQNDISYSLYNLSDEDNRIQLFNSITENGPANGKNLGMYHATGNYFLFLDDDDILEPRALEYMVSTAKKYDADLVMGNIKYQNTRNLRKKVLDGHMVKQIFTPKNMNNCMYYPYVLSNKLWKSDMLIHNYIKFKNIYIGEDVLFYNCALSRCNKVVTVPNYVVSRSIKCDVSVNHLATCYDNPFDLIRQNYVYNNQENYIEDVIFEELEYYIDALNHLYLIENKYLKRKLFRFLSNNKYLYDLKLSNSAHNDLAKLVYDYKKIKHKKFFYTSKFGAKRRLNFEKRSKKIASFFNKIRRKK